MWQCLGEQATLGRLPWLSRRRHEDAGDAIVTATKEQGELTWELDSDPGMAGMMAEDSAVVAMMAEDSSVAAMT